MMAISGSGMHVIMINKGQLAISGSEIEIGWLAGRWLPDFPSPDRNRLAGRQVVISIARLRTVRRDISSNTSRLTWLNLAQPGLTWLNLAVAL